MQPGQYKQLSVVLLVMGVILACLGLAAIYILDAGTVGAVLLLIGCALALMSLPTFMILTLLGVGDENRQK